MRRNKKLWLQRGLGVCAVLLIPVCCFLTLGTGRLVSQVESILDRHIETGFSARSGKISFFPAVGLAFQGVRIPGKGNTKFIDDCDITLIIDPLKAVFGEISLRKIRLSNGTIHVENTPEGFNYAVFHQDGSSGERAADPELTIHRTDLSDLRFSYKDVQQGHDFDLRVKSGSLKGSFSAPVVALEVNLQIHSDQIVIGQHAFAQHIPMRLSGKMEMNTDHGYFTFRNMQCTAGRTTCQLSGSVRDWKTHTAYRLDFEARKGDLADLSHLLPDKLRTWERWCRLAGNFRAQAAIRGRSSKNEHPHISMQLKLENGRIYFPMANEEVTGVSCDIGFDNGGARTGQTTSIVLDHFSGTFAGEPMQANARIEHLNFPILNGSFRGRVPVRIFNSDSSVAEFRSGFLVVPQMEIRNLWLELITPQRFLESAKGSFEPQALQLIYQDNPVVLDGGEVWVENGEFAFDSLDVRYASSSGMVSGTLDQLGRSVQTQDPNLLIYHVEIDAEKIRVDDFIAGKSAVSNSKFGQGAARFVHQKQIVLPSGRFSGHVDTLIWGNRQIEDMRFTCTTTPHTILGKSGFNNAGGKIESDIRIHCDHQYRMDARVSATGVDLSGAFLQWDNFGQNLITAEQIDGRMDGHAWINASLNRQGKIIPKSLHAALGFQVSDGELNRLDILEQFSKYIHIRDLQNLRFATLRNYIEIKNGQVFIPAMFIQSNAANLTVNGVHGLDQRILYHLKINAGQVLGKQFKKFNPNLDPLPARKDGFMNLYFTVFGTTRDFRYETNKAAVRSGIARSKTIRQNVLNILKAEFGDVPEWFEPDEWKDIPEYDVPLIQPGQEFRYLDAIRGFPE